MAQFPTCSMRRCAGSVRNRNVAIAMLAISSSQKIAVVQAGCSRNETTSETGLGFIADYPSTEERAASPRRRLRAKPFDKARSLRVRALAHQGHDCDLVVLRLVNAPNDHPVDTGGLDKANAQLGLNHGDVAGHVFAGDRPPVLGLDASFQLLLDGGLADTRGPA